MNNAELLIMTGLPYAGKTTLRQKIVEMLNYPVVSIDEINTKRAIGLDPNVPITSNEWTTTYSEAYRQILEYLLSGRTVLFDAANFTRKEREDARQIAIKTGSETKVIYVDTPADVCRTRWQKNNSTKERAVVREDDFNLVLNNFEVPTNEENVIIYSNDQNSEEWIDNNLI